MSDDDLCVCGHIRDEHGLDRACLQAIEVDGMFEACACVHFEAADSESDAT